VENILEERTVINQNYEKLIKLNLNKMAELYKEQSSNKIYMEMSFDERLALLIDGETDDKFNKLIYGIQRRSNIKMSNATISDIKFYPDREIDKALTAKLSTCDYIQDHLNVIVIGATGAGKTYYISALGNEACKKAINVKYIRLPDLLYDLDQARAKGNYKKKLRALSRIELLIIDEFLLTPTTSEQQSDILELLELRYNTHSTIFASQFIPQGWHENLGSSAIADAILDRITANSYLIHIKGSKSMRVREFE